MRICPKCAHENEDDIDFCSECGTYLRWEPTRLVPVVKPPAEEPPPAAPEEGEGESEPPAAAGPAIPAPVLRTMDMPVVRMGGPPPEPAAGPQGAVTSETVLISLTYPDSTDLGEKLVVAAGGRAILRALVRNQSGIVDNYEIRVEGMQDAWWSVTPPAVYLVPFGAPSGVYEQEVQIQFEPPRSAEAQARIWEIEVVAVSKAHATEAGSTAGRVEITPYEDLESELRPELVAGRRRAGFALMVRNRANAPIDTVISAVDSQNACAFEFEKSRFVAEPGRRDGTTFYVRPKKRIVIGRHIDRRFEIVARAAAGHSTARPINGVYRQRPWIPFWVPIVVPVLVAAAVLLLSLIPHMTTVPLLRNASLKQVTCRLEHAHLTFTTIPPEQPVAVSAAICAPILNPPKSGKQPPLAVLRVATTAPPSGARVKQNSSVTVYLVTDVPYLKGQVNGPQLQLEMKQRGLVLSVSKEEISKEPPGTILAQYPPAATPVTPGGAKATVLITIARASGRKQVPNVEGMTIGEAQQELSNAGFSMVLANPLAPGQNPRTVKISLQTPGPNTTVTASEAVSVYIAPPVPPKSKKVPVLAGLLGAAAVPKLIAAGFTPTLAYAFNTKPAGTVIGETKQAHGKVLLLESDGYPEVAFSDGTHIFEMSGAGGAATKIATRATSANEPSWQPGGTLLAYRGGPSSSSGEIWVTVTAKAGNSTRMTAGPNDRRPVFSPNGKVIAFIRDVQTSGGTQGDLCFVAVNSRLHQGVCVSDAHVSVDRPTWSPDGRSILVVATDPSDPTDEEVAEFTSTQPDSPVPADWTFEGPLSANMPAPAPGQEVIFAAFSPAGNEVALVANWGQGSLFHVFLAPWANGALGAPREIVPTLLGCEVAWRQDAGELLVTQSDDDCVSGSGQIVGVTFGTGVGSGAQTSLLAANGQNPAWASIALLGQPPAPGKPATEPLPRQATTAQPATTPAVSTTPAAATTPAGTPAATTPTSTGPPINVG